MTATLLTGMPATVIVVRAVGALAARRVRDHAASICCDGRGGPGRGVLDDSRHAAVWLAWTGDLRAVSTASAHLIGTIWSPRLDIPRRLGAETILLTGGGVPRLFRCPAPRGERHFGMNDREDTVGAVPRGLEQRRIMGQSRAYRVRDKWQEANSWPDSDRDVTTPAIFDHAAGRIRQEVRDRSGLDPTQLLTLAAVQELEHEHQTTLRARDPVPPTR